MLIYVYHNSVRVYIVYATSIHMHSLKKAHLQNFGLALNSSVLIIGCSLFNYISFSPFVPTKGAKALHLVQLFVVAVAAVTASC